MRKPNRSPSCWRWNDTSRTRWANTRQKKRRASELELFRKNTFRTICFMTATNVRFKYAQNACIGSTCTAWGFGTPSLSNRLRIGVVILWVYDQFTTICCVVIEQNPISSSKSKTRCPRVGPISPFNLKLGLYSVYEHVGTLFFQTVFLVIYYTDKHFFFIYTMRSLWETIPTSS